MEMGLEESVLCVCVCVLHVISAVESACSMQHVDIF